ncbi:MAG: hypothetical protein HQK49_22730 [Oligoflexia bacterium]|nr:hypothetical protein [Oligoflexia bacterium]
MKITNVNDTEKIKYLKSYFWPVFTDKSNLFDSDNYISFEENVKDKKILNIFYNNNDQNVSTFLKTKLADLNKNKSYFHIVLYPSNTSKEFENYILNNYYGSVVLYREDALPKSKEDIIGDNFIVKRGPLSDQNINDICKIWNDLFHIPFY